MYIFRNKILYNYYAASGEYKDVRTSYIKYFPNFEQHICTSHSGKYIVYESECKKTFIYDMDVEGVICKIPTIADWVWLDDGYIYVYKNGKNGAIYLREIHTLQVEILYRFAPDSVMGIGAKWDLIQRADDFPDINYNSILIIEDYYAIVDFNTSVISIHDLNKNKMYEFKIHHYYGYAEAYILNKQYLVISNSNNISVYDIYGELVNSIDYNPDNVSISRNAIVEVQYEKYIVSPILEGIYEIAI